MAEALPTVYSLLPKRNMELEKLYFNHKSNMFEYWNSKIHLGIDPNARVSKYMYNRRSKKEQDNLGSQNHTEQGSHRLVRMHGKTKYIYHSNCEKLYARRWMHVIGGDSALVANSYMISRSLIQGIPVILVHGGTLEHDRSELSEFWTFALSSKAIIDRYHTSTTYTLNTYDALAFDRFLKGELTIQGQGQLYAPNSGRQLNIITMMLL